MDWQHDSERGTGRSRKQLEEIVDRVFRDGKRTIFVTPAPGPYWFTLARDIARDKGHQVVVRWTTKELLVGDGVIEFRARDRSSFAESELDRLSHHHDVVYDHAA